MSGSVNYSIPAMYDHANLISNLVSPSTIHVHNSALSRFFSRYLMQKAMSVFKWELPENWSKEYFLYTLYTTGYIGVVETARFGVICQGGFLSGYDIYYRPTDITMCNPNFKTTIRAKIGEYASLITLQPDRGGIGDLVSYYADMMALCAEAAGVNLINSHMAFAFSAESKSQAESYKKAFDKVASGEPAIVLDSSLFDEQGNCNWKPFAQDIGRNYITDQLLSDMRKIECMFDTAIGIPNANTDKKERLITDEVNANNTETRTLADLWLETLNTGVKQTNDMFGTNITVKWREEVNQNERYNVNSRLVLGE